MRIDENMDEKTLFMFLNGGFEHEGGHCVHYSISNKKELATILMDYVIGEYKMNEIRADLYAVYNGAKNLINSQEFLLERVEGDYKKDLNDNYTPLDSLMFHKGNYDGLMKTNFRINGIYFDENNIYLKNCKKTKSFPLIKQSINNI